MTATLPAAIAVVLWWKNGRFERRDVLRLAAMIPFGVAAGALTSWMERYSVGAAGREWLLTPVDRLIVAGRAFWFYLGKLAWPHPLIFVYPRWKLEGASVAMLVFPAAALGLFAALWIARRRIGRGPLTAALLYAGTLAPVLGFVNFYPMRYSFVADHFAYLAAIAPLVLLVAAVATALRPWQAAGPWLARGLGVVAVSVLAALTWYRGHAYADQETLWRDTLREDPDSFIANDNLGGILFLRGELEAAASLLERALRSKPDFAEGLDNLGLVRLRQGRLDDAIALFRDAIRCEPKFVGAHNNLGLVLAQTGQPTDALEQFHEAVRIQPSFAKAHKNLGLVFENLGRMNDAAGEFRETLRWTPEAHDVEKELAWILATDPDPRVRNGAEAVRLAEAASSAAGDRDPQALNVLAAAYAEAGRFDAAVRSAERALDLAGAPAGTEARQRAERRLALYRLGRALRRPPAR